MNEKTQKSFLIKSYFVRVWNNSLPSKKGIFIEDCSLEEAEIKYETAIQMWDNVEIIEEIINRKVVKSNQ